MRRYWLLAKLVWKVAKHRVSTGPLPPLLLEPVWADCSQPICSIINHAFELSKQQREDRDAVNSLIRAARFRRGKRGLILAANSVRQRGRCEEDEIDDRAWRLLVAAANDQDVGGITAEQAFLFEQVHELQSEPLGPAFSSLVRLEPRLRGVAEYVEDLAASKETDHQSLAKPSKVESWRYFEHRLEGLVGSGASTPLLATYAALDVAFIFLENVYNKGRDITPTSHENSRDF